MWKSNQNLIPKNWFVGDAVMFHRLSSVPSTALTTWNTSADTVARQPSSFVLEQHTSVMGAMMIFSESQQFPKAYCHIVQLVRHWFIYYSFCRLIRVLIGDIVNFPLQDHVQSNQNLTSVPSTWLILRLVKNSPLVVGYAAMPTLSKI